jgi:hypothetical protein
VPGPAAADRDAIARKRVFVSAYRMLEKRIGLFASLRLEEFNCLALKRKVDEIGKIDLT